MRPGLVFAALAALVAAAPLAGAQQHSHAGEAMVVVAHDGPPDGRAVVGNVAHFAAIILDAQGMPAFHHNLEVRVELNGLVLFATTPDSGHDYDGVFEFDVVFPVPGAYTITATSDGDVQATGTFAGYVVPMDAPLPATLQLDLPASIAAGQPFDLTYQIVDGQGQLLPHTDALVEVREAAAGHVLYRVHTHTHEEAQQLTLTLPLPGPYVARVLGYTAFPTARAPQFPAFVTEQAFEVAPGLPDLGVAPVAPVPPGAMNQVDEGEAGGEYVLLTTYDPFTVVGPFSQTRLSALVLNATTMDAVQHVNFEATLTDALGRVLLHSASLHEYDGVLEILVGDAPVGQYHLAVEASRGNWTGTASAHYTVAPPVEAMSAGPQIVEASGLDEPASGAPTDIDLFIHDLAGMPFSHGEVDLQVVPSQQGAAPILATKLHTHDDGHFPFTLTFPAAGDYDLIATPFALEARPTPVFYGGSLGAPAVFHFTVAGGAALPVGQPLQATSADDAAPPRATPGAELGWVALGTLAAALLARRRG
ncbi:MAG TPA: hypothetical protein VGR28_05095 [Candidatus Thermoplasmatota archaeon]|jgi:hypothetical protein|nr:hypothetical protein [Candidatus Thermoplasmatota archaeon]